MGDNFDALVEITKKNVKNVELSYVKDVKKYLDNLINRSVLFEFPINSKKILEKTGKSKSEYDQDLKDHFDLSAEYGEYFITPAKITAIDDDISVVIFDWIKDDQFIVTSCRSSTFGDEGDLEDKVTMLNIGHVRVSKPSVEMGGFFIAPVPLYYIIDLQKKGSSKLRNIDQRIQKAMVTQDLYEGALSYVEQVVYIMNPENFIIRVESKEYQVQQEKNKKSKKKNKGKNVLNKTVMRPRYLLKDEKQIKQIYRGYSGGTKAPHFVRGSKRTLSHERYGDNMGKVIRVQSYWTGDGRIEKEGGIVYQVMDREDSGKVITNSRRQSMRVK